MNKQAPNTPVGKRAPKRSRIHDDPAFQEGRQSRVELVRLGMFLRNVRERRGLTQMDVAGRAGFSQPEICRLETANAQNGPEYGTILRYLEACRVSLTIRLNDKTNDTLVTFVDDSGEHPERLSREPRVHNGTGR